jgi:hypothetical protein
MGGLCPLRRIAPNNDINRATPACRSLNRGVLGSPGFNSVSYVLLTLPELQRREQRVTAIVRVLSLSLTRLTVRATRDDRHSFPYLSWRFVDTPPQPMARRWELE